MTRFPARTALLAVIPLAALAWPLSMITGNTLDQTPVGEGVDPDVGSVVRTDIFLSSTAPYDFVKITQGATTFTLNAEQSDIETPLKIDWENTGKGSSVMTIEVQWKASSTENAVRLEFSPDSLETQTVSLWGHDNAVEEITLNWKKI